MKETHSLEAQKVQKQLFKHICMDIAIYNMTEKKCIPKFDSLNQVWPSNSPYRSEVESIDNDFYSLKYNVYSGFYLNLRPELDRVE